MLQPDTPWAPGAAGWSRAPVPMWGNNPNLRGPAMLATHGLGQEPSTGAKAGIGLVGLLLAAGTIGLVVWSVKEVGTLPKERRSYARNAPPKDTKAKRRAYLYDLASLDPGQAAMVLDGWERAGRVSRTEYRGLRAMLASRRSYARNAGTYKIVRFFQRDRRPRVIRRGLTLEEAQAHCRDPETSSSKATSAKAQRYTKLWGPWFDGYDEEK